MLRVRNWRHLLLCAMLVTGLVISPMAVLAEADEASDPEPMPTTLRVYGADSLGAGDLDAVDPYSGRTPEDAPYTGEEGVNSIFDPQAPQAPRRDSVTFNPVWMYEKDTFDENQQRGLYHQLYADDANISEKVWFRMWYEPDHLDFEGYAQYPAIMEEFTYILMDPPKHGMLDNSPDPAPTCGVAGRTQFVFPVGMRYDQLYDNFGYGLTSFDANFDNMPNIVEVDSEITLARKTGVEADFNHNGYMDHLDGYHEMDDAADEDKAVEEEAEEEATDEEADDAEADEEEADAEAEAKDGADEATDDEATEEDAEEAVEEEAADEEAEEEATEEADAEADEEATDEEAADEDAADEEADEEATDEEADDAEADEEATDEEADEEADDEDADAKDADEAKGAEDFLSGDELVVFSIAPQKLSMGNKLRFLDHIIQVENVTDDGVTVHIWYTGDLTPVDMGTQTLTLGDLWSYKTRLPGIQAGMTSMISLGAFFVHVSAVDLTEGTTHLRVGRALGAPYANLDAGEPGNSLKRFYVDGHEYNVTAIGVEGKDNFCFITIRTPVPKVDVTNKAHSVRLQGYDFNQQLSVMPPYNFEHYILADVVSEQTDEENADVVLGELIGPVPPIVSLKPGQAVEYFGAYPEGQDIDGWYPSSKLIENPGPVQRSAPSPVEYTDAAEMQFTYVKEEEYNEFEGQILELYTEETKNHYTEESWRAHSWDTEPSLFTEFVLPDIADVDDLYLQTSTITADASDGARVATWFDPSTSGSRHATPDWLRIYGMANDSPGDADAVDPVNEDYAVEVLPYTDPQAPFDPQADQAPVHDSITFNPAFLSEFQSCNNDPLRTEIYPKIAIAGHDAIEKVWFRMWYEPEYTDTILGEDMEYSYPALMQEFSYMFLDTKDEPTYAPPGWGTYVFPVGATLAELFHPHGFGLTSFDADFDGWENNVVRVHSEQSLAQLTNVAADFDGNGQLDDIDASPEMNGDEMVVFAVEGITLSYNQPYAIFLDHMVELKNITTNGKAMLQLWNTSGGLDVTPDEEFHIQPHLVGSPEPYAAGTMGITGCNKVNIVRLYEGQDNLGEVDGPWFVYVTDVNTNNETVSVNIGRALGATHSAIDNGDMRHDLENDDPWYLKRFFVDGHEYNVVAIRNHAEPNNYDKSGNPSTYNYGFKYITIRTPVPKVDDFVNAQDSVYLQGYTPDGSTISVMPPFNLDHSIAVDVLDHHDDVGVIGQVDVCRPPLKIDIKSEDVESNYKGELKEVLKVEDGELVWTNQPFHTKPDNYTEVVLPADDLYLLTMRSWNDSNGNDVKLRYNPGETLDVFVNGELEAEAEEEAEVEEEADEEAADEEDAADEDAADEEAADEEADAEADTEEEAVEEEAEEATEEEAEVEVEVEVEVVVEEEAMDEGKGHHMHGETHYNADGKRVHRVSDYETLIDIAKRYDVTVVYLAKINDVKNASDIQPGVMLLIDGYDE